MKVDSISSSYAVIQWTLGFRDDGCKYTDFTCLRGTVFQHLVEPYMQSCVLLHVNINAIISHMINKVSISHLAHEFEGVLEECPKSRPSRIPVEFDR